MYFSLSETISRHLPPEKCSGPNRAGNGEPGKGSKKSGSDGADMRYRYHTGTILKDAQTGEIIKDLTVSIDGFSSKGAGWVARGIPTLLLP
jgi:GTPase involved in cell partitioning and DNA repair